MCVCVCVCGCALTPPRHACCCLAGMAVLQLLPDDLLIDVLLRLRLRDLGSLSATSRGLRELLRPEAIWKAVLEVDPAYPRSAPLCSLCPTRRLKLLT